MIREPYTDDFVCTVHHRKGSSLAEADCPPEVFAPIKPAAAAPAASSPAPSSPRPSLNADYAAAALAGEPYTDAWICRLHNRKGSHPDERNCPVEFFISTAATMAAPKKYKRRPEPPEVEATAWGAVVYVAGPDGTGYPMPRDQFFALYEEVIEPRPDVEAAHERIGTGPSAAVSHDEEAQS